MSAYPLTASGQMVDAGAIERFATCLFAHVDWNEGGVVAMLGIGEKGTPQEGKFRDRKFIRPGEGSMMIAHAKRWAEHEVATFIVPAVVHNAAVDDHDVKLDKIMAFTAVVVDLDSGATEIKLQHLERHLGRPTMVVASGGKTHDGSPKLHAYWRLTEPSTEIDRIAAARKLLAAKVGGDQAFGRATQVIRLPGSVHAKNGVANPVTIRTTDGPDYDLDELLEAIEAMRQVAGSEGAPEALPWTPGGEMDFSAGAGQQAHTMADTLTSEVHEGGDDINRWGEFSKVAGLEIANARKGLQTLDQAFELVQGWVLAKMVPPWPIERIRQEFAGILNVDVKQHGPIGQVAELMATPELLKGDERTGTDDLLTWGVHRWVSPEPPQRRILVDGLVFAGKKHMLVAEGGAGKTFLCMDLAMKLAAASEDRPMTWLGQPIQPEAYGGTVIMMTAEDDREELDIRFHAIDPNGDHIRAAGDRLIALPLDNLGGAFPLVAIHPHTRQPGPSPKWASLFQAMQGIEARGGRVSAVIIDTLNSTLHGEENSALVISEYLREVGPTCTKLGAALIVTHHVRKAGSEPIKTAEDMRDAIRGSTALVNGMRAVVGVWAVHDYERKLRAMNLPVQRATLFKAAVVKANNPEVLKEAKTLLRAPSGLLEDVTGHEVATRGPNPEAVAWLEWAAKRAADKRAPFARSGANGIHARRFQLPALFHKMSRDTDLMPLVEWMLSNGRLILTPVTNGGNSHTYLDVPECKNVIRRLEKTDALDLEHNKFFYDHGHDEIVEFGRRDDD